MEGILIGRDQGKQFGKLKTMPLSCGCDWDYDLDYGDWVYYWDCTQDFKPLSTTRAKRCVSCGNLIPVGALCILHPRLRYGYNEIEARITGSDPENGEPTIGMAPHYQCERYGEIWLNLQAAGYECLSPTENMEEALKEYHDISGFKKAS